MNDDRIEICQRHGLDPKLAKDLRGKDPRELEADAAARAAIARIEADRQREGESTVIGGPS